MLLDEACLPSFLFFLMMFDPVAACNNENDQENCNYNSNDNPFSLRFLWHCSLVNSDLIEGCRCEFVVTLKTHVTFVSLYEVLSSLKLEIWSTLD
jgi:hypothetical protein